jgi:Mg2+/Co2+ transporter CorB
MAPYSVLAPSLIAVVILLLLSAFFSSSESAIFSLPDEGTQTATEDDTRESRTLHQLRANPHRLLVTLLVGNNIVNIALTSIITLLVARFVPAKFTVVIATLSVSVLILVFGEIVPKSYGLGHAESWSLRVARPISYVERTLGPLVALFDIITRWLTTLIGGDQYIEKPYLDD